jgi:hypothetical protein
VRRAAEALLRHFEERIGRDTVAQHLTTFLTLSEYSKTWVLQHLRERMHEDMMAALSLLRPLSPELREEALRALRDEVASRTFSVQAALPLVAGRDAAMNSLGWEMLAASAISREVAAICGVVCGRPTHGSQRMFLRQLQVVTRRAKCLCALTSAAKKSKRSWRKLPAFFGALTPAFFVAVFRVLSPSTQVERALLANEDQWNAARDVLLQTLREPRALAPFGTRYSNV